MQMEYQYKILIVEDDKIMLLFNKLALNEINALVMTAVSGEEAVVIANHEELDLIIMDVGLPGIDGLEALRQIRTGDKNKTTPAIFISALSKNEMNTIAALDMGAVDFISKPPSRNILSLKVRNILILQGRRRDFGVIGSKISKTINDIESKIISPENKPKIWTKNSVDTNVSVLLIDSKEAGYSQMKGLLSSVLTTNYALDWENNSNNALEKLLNSNYDVFIVAFRLDKTIGGLDLLYKANSMKFSKPAVIIVSEKDELPDFMTLRNVASDYIFKEQISSALLDKTLACAIERNRILLELDKSKADLRDQLTLAQAKLNQLTGWQSGSVTAHLSGVGPLRARQPKEFNILEARYDALLEIYLDALSRNKKPEFDLINKFAWDVGDLGGGPRDIIDFHISTVKNKTRTNPPKRMLAFTVEGRLLVIELMGYLVDYYRLRS